MRTHAIWIVSAALLAFAVDGFMAHMGETMSSGLGLHKSIIAVIASAVFFWVYSVITEPPPKKPTRKPKTPLQNHIDH